MSPNYFEEAKSRIEAAATITKISNQVMSNHPDNGEKRGKFRLHNKPYYSLLCKRFNAPKVGSTP